MSGSEIIAQGSLCGNLTDFRFFQCTNPDCGLRFPLDIEVHQGSYCPRCGALLNQISFFQENAYYFSPEKPPTRQISCLLDNIRSAYNVGAIFRTADGVGLTHLYLCGLTPSPGDNPSVGKTALGAEKRLSWSSHLNALVLAAHLSEQGCRLVGLECTPKATPIYRFRGEPPDDRPIVLVVGNERTGVDLGLLDLCDEVLALPMTGEKESLNVAVAFGVAAYWLTYI